MMEIVLWIFEMPFYVFRFKAVAAKSKLDLVNEGFTEFTIEDFHNTVRSEHIPIYVVTDIPFVDMGLFFKSC